jgi:hypothetical protein
MNPINDRRFTRFASMRRRKLTLRRATSEHPRATAAQAASKPALILQTSTPTPP